MEIHRALWKKGNNFNKKQTVTNLHFYVHLKPSRLSAEIAQYEASWPVTRETRDRYPVNSFLLFIKIHYLSLFRIVLSMTIMFH